MAIIPSVTYYDELAESYQDAFSHDTGLQIFIQDAIVLLKPNSKALDVGCGTGRPVSTTAAAHGVQVQGVDLSPAMISLCRKQIPNGQFEVANMLEYDPINPVDADIVFAIFSLFCLGGRKETMFMFGKFHKWLKPSGVLCIGTICAADLKTTEEMYEEDGICANNVTMTFLGSETGGMTAFTKDGWRLVLEEAGFDIFYTKTDLFVPKGKAGVASDDEMHYFIMARKRASGLKL
jgi:ubiquinone/menaquinone biosynthesis C-methylase UbiE